MGTRMMLERRLKVLCLLTAVSIATAGIPSLMAQSAATGALTGTVSDSSGAVIPKVTVTATNVATGQSRNLTTGTTGLYKFSLLPPGEYRVKFSGEGFQSIEVPSVIVNVTETAVLNRTLEVGVQAESVTVQASGGTVDTETSTLGTLISAETVTTLPLTSRNFTQILNLSAGVSSDVNNATALGRGTQATTSVNGSNPGQNSYQMDGVSNNSIGYLGNPSDQSGSSGLSIPSPDAIEEFKIQTSTYDASYGRNPGANVNVVTKSGSGHFHGTAFEFLRNSALNANDYFYDRDNPLAVTKKQVLDQNQFGGTIGGPIKKDKLFFFTSYQGTRQKNGVAGQGLADVYLPPIPDDRTSPTFAAELAAANCGNSNFIPGTPNVACDGSNINPVALKILQLKNRDGSWYFPGSGTSGYKHVQFSDPARFTEDQVVANVDYLISAKHTLQTKYFYSRDPIFAPMGAITGNMPGDPDTIQTYNHNALVRLTSLLSNAFTNEARISYQRNASYVSDTQPPNSTPADLGMATLVDTTRAPWLDILTGGIHLFNAFDPSNGITDQIQVGDQIAWSRGKHTIRAGGEYENVQYYTDPGLQRGFLLIGSFNDLLVGQVGNIFGCPACGIGTGPQGDTVHSYRLHDISAFVQDDWKIEPRLTLNLGLRWEFDGALSDIFGNLTDVWPSLLASAPVPSGPSNSADAYAGYVVPDNFRGTLPDGVLKTHSGYSYNHPPYSNFAPRFGFAWQPTSKDNLVLRGGVGLFYDRVWGDAMVRSFTSGPPYATTFNTSFPNTETLQDPFPTPTTPLGSFPQRWANFATGATSGLSAYFLNPDVHAPLVRSYNLNVQYEFAPKWLLEVGYVGSSGINLLDEYHNYNTAELASPTHPVNGLTTSTLANLNLRVPYLGYSPVGLQGTAFDGMSNYNSLQVTLRKQFSHGLMMQAAYTWSKSLSDLVDDAVSKGQYAANSNNANDFSQQYGPSDFNRPQRFVVNYTYDLPLGVHHGAAGTLLNGWSVAGVTTVQDGAPLTIYDANAGSIYGTSSNARAQLCPGMTAANILSHGSVASRLNNYFNTSTFCPAPVVSADGGTDFGNSGVGTVLGPGQFNWDITVMKGFKIAEAQTVQFRTELYNAFNHPQFANPNTTLGSTFGQITATSVNPRIIQFGLRYTF
jgi:hypothetical protein